MDTRREFFFKTAMLAGGSGLASVLLPAIDKAAQIQPTAGTTFLDAEHVVILMQENRSFDHCFGSLQGVRGFNDPRAVVLPNQHPAWLQTNAAGETFAPFRLDAQETNATWLGSLPHSWSDQNDAKNLGNHDKWLIAKPSGREVCAGMPLTMGYYNREDLPFYYALADAFTVCDQYFCSSLTGTTPNRLYLWTGTIRQTNDPAAPANVRNSDVDYDLPARWTTFPERLEQVGVSWKIYQNDLSIPSGLSEEEDAWLGNFTDNPLEWFPQFNIEFSKSRREYLSRIAPSLPAEIKALENEVNRLPPDQKATRKLRETLASKRTLLAKAQSSDRWTPKEFAKLSATGKRLHARAFTTNENDPHYRSLTPLRYTDGDAVRELSVPKGDVLHQFRTDVGEGKLPTVSWLVAPERFSDHPTAPWYGAWYLAEVMNILTQNPEVWKKTIFLLTYDENDGFFDHVPPFAAPYPGQSHTGAVSCDIDTACEHVTLEQDVARGHKDQSRGGSIGLGFRVPVVVASPWSRGGAVCSQVFDHTSILQLLEKFVGHKVGKPVLETNITEWRRTVCGDLTSAFEPAHKSQNASLPFPAKDDFIERIHKAQFKRMPSVKPMTPSDIANSKDNRTASVWAPHQEPGVRRSRALPYELAANGRLLEDRRAFEIVMRADATLFGKRSAGAPFHVYAPEKYTHNGESNRVRSYAAAAGHSVQGEWHLDGFTDSHYHLCVHGPNGFFREFMGNAHDPSARIEARQQTEITTSLELVLWNEHAHDEYAFVIEDNAYDALGKKTQVRAAGQSSLVLDLEESFGWYDFTIRILGFENFAQRFAGRVESGQPSYSDPAMDLASKGLQPS